MLWFDEKRISSITNLNSFLFKNPFYYNSLKNISISKGCDKVENNPIPILLTKKQLMADIDVVKIVQKWIEISNQLLTKLELFLSLKSFLH